ncbi:transporter substrate-binding domain-containing protein [Ammonicoccus fulvus]|uniref:Transporter substrate-binding domain-containing protein n=1 Tax=Ammonicoccus fulvus TaxID=3138240 RepID=A0ABZ3FUE6_9ACTN
MRLFALLCLLLSLVLAACGTIPSDPKDTLDNVRSRGELVVGVSPTPPWTTAEGPDRVGGTEVELIRGFAERLGVRPRWVVGGEQSLVAELEDGALDVAIGGFTKDSPWAALAGATRPYATAPDKKGREQEHIMLVPMGENAFLSELERYLDEQTGKTTR